MIRHGEDRNGNYRVIAADDPEEMSDEPGWQERRDLIRNASAVVANLVLTVRCVPRAGCGHDGKSGADLAGVYRTHAGLLWCSEPVVAHDAVPTFRQIHGDAAMVMRHPVTGGVAETTREAFEKVWQSKGWQEGAPSDLPPQWRPQNALRVRDLIDRDDLPHVTLRVSCPRHRAAVVDRGRLLAEIDRTRARRFQTTRAISHLSALCPLDS